MTVINEIPLTADNQTFNMTLAGTNYQFQVLWRDVGWFLDLLDSGGTPIISGIPLVAGYSLLEQYIYLGLGFALYVTCDDLTQQGPTKTDLGSCSHLLVVTE